MKLTRNGNEAQLSILNSYKQKEEIKVNSRKIS